MIWRLEALVRLHKVGSPDVASQTYQFMVDDDADADGRSGASPRSLLGGVLSPRASMRSPRSPRSPHTHGRRGGAQARASTLRGSSSSSSSSRRGSSASPTSPTSPRTFEPPSE
jgi:hypothetical protein